MRLLIIGEGTSEVGTASRIAKEHGAHVLHAHDISAALSLLSSGKGADLILADVVLDVGNLLSRLLEERICVPVACYGLNAEPARAVAAIKAGAREFIPLPPDEKLIAAILETISERKPSLLYTSAAMKQIIALADKVAPSDANVLITGESGTGKEVIACYIHEKSRRAGEAFVPLNCAAVPDNLLESELFGHEKGAFTGALHRRIGKFEEADNGTLLLDEISEMDLRLQAKLLRAIQEREIDRIGGSKPVKLNLRILATSNRDLKAESAKGTFREDLLFRLNVIHLHLPPLRERQEDIAMLAEHFARKYAEVNELPAPEISATAMARLKEYHWPGNVRELENTMHRAVLLGSGSVINEGALLFYDNQNAAAQEGKLGDNIRHLVGRTVESVEHDLIVNTLQHCLGNRTQAANILGISIRTLRNKLKQYGDMAERV